MRNRSPVYDLLHQEIKACAAHLLELSQNLDFSKEIDGKHVVERLNELRFFALKIRRDERYHPLLDLKIYLENTMLPYHDGKERIYTIRLSEAVALLAKGELAESAANALFKPELAQSLFHHLVTHFLQECRPGYPLFYKLLELHRI
ncbi:MAG: hypothetical protein JSS61_07075 [Verrucomicrobia bacterium]|nr:hypothetical protein [Verrucomicrobiota bacterium]